MLRNGLWNRLSAISAVCALLTEAGVEIHYLGNSPFSMTEFTLKAKRIQYAASNPAMVAKLREVVGR